MPYPASGSLTGAQPPSRRNLSLPHSSGVELSPRLNHAACQYVHRDTTRHQGTTSLSLWYQIYTNSLLKLNPSSVRCRCSLFSDFRPSIFVHLWTCGFPLQQQRRRCPYLYASPHMACPYRLSEAGLGYPVCGLHHLTDRRGTVLRCRRKSS